MQNNASPSGEKILEGNKAIAEFMGGKKRWITNKLYLRGVDPFFVYDFPDKRCTHQDGLTYHSSWDRLKPVVDKIFTYSLAHRDQTERLRKTSIVVDIIPCWQICVDFITWYNQQTPHQ